MMQTIKVSEVKLGSNVRQDIGDITDLRRSIRKHGVRIPVVLDENKKLIAGHRRMQAAKEEGLTEIPFITTKVKDEESRFAFQMLENLHRKGLTPIEEARAYSDFLKTHKKSIQDLSEAVNKTEAYIERRLVLLRTIPEVMTALEGGSIELGHALLLGQMNKVQQKVCLKNIVDYDLTVQNFSDQVRWMEKLDFGRLEFRPGELRGQRTLFDSIGQKVNPKSDVLEYGDDPKENPAFKKEIAEYIESQREVLRKKGITVFASVEKLKRTHPNAKQIQSWEDRFSKVVKSLKGSKDYAVVVDLESYGMGTEVFELEPKKRKDSDTMAYSETPEARENAEKELELDRRQRLKNRIGLYVRENLLKNVENFVLNAKREKQNVMVLWALSNGSYDHAGRDLIAKELSMLDRYHDVPDGKWIAKTSELDVNKSWEWILKTAAGQYGEMGDADLKAAMKFLGFDFGSHWKIDEEYLNLHTKAQLQGLMKELKLDDVDGKKPEMVKGIFDQAKVGMVPKEIAKQY